MLRFFTSGESHGPALMAILDGIPSGLKIDLGKVNHELWRRQQGYGRGSRQKIESDQVEFVGGIRHGMTSGAPIGILIRNKDWDNWQHVMSVEDVDVSVAEIAAQLDKKAIRRFRPGHADLAGALKFRQRDIRDVLERSSARETAVRVAVGAVCQQLLGEFGIKLVGHVIQVGSVKASPLDAATSASMNLEELETRIDQSEMFCADPKATQEMCDLIKTIWQEGDSLGGVVEILASGLPVGLGSYTQWDSRLDGQLAQAVMSIQAIKAVEIGDGVEGASRTGSLVHDALFPVIDDKDISSLPFCRKTNHAGGIEGGMTNGERLRIRAYMKPIPTLRKGLPSLTFPDFNAETAHYERSDVSAISAASVVCKAMVSFVLSRVFLEKFGGDTIADMKVTVSNYHNYCHGLGTGSGSVASARRSGATDDVDGGDDIE